MLWFMLEGWVLFWGLWRNVSILEADFSLFTLKQSRAGRLCCAFMENTRFGVCSFFPSFSYLILIFLRFPLYRQIEMSAFSCSGMRSHFLCVTFKMPVLSNAQPLFWMRAGMSLASLLLKIREGKKRIWLLHLKQIKVSFFPKLFTCLGCLPRNNCQQPTLSYGQKVS